MIRMKLILVNVLFLPCSICLVFENNNKYFSEKTLDVLKLFNETDCFCVVSNNDTIISEFLRNIKEKAITITNFAFGCVENCDFVILEKLANDLCKLLSSLKKSKHSAYILNTAQTNITLLEDCLSDSWLSEVIFVSMEEGILYQLSPVFPPPRSISVSSVAQVMDHRRSYDGMNLGGTILTAATMNYTPFTILKDPTNPDDADGLEVLLFDELSHQLNFTLKRWIHKAWGKYFDNGSWSGDMGQAMQDGRADLAIACLWEVLPIYGVMDYGPSLNTMQISFIVRRPVVAGGARFGSLSAVFKPSIWIGTAISFALVLIMDRTSAAWRTRLKYENKKKVSILSTALSPSELVGSVVKLIGYFLMTTSSDPGKENTMSRFNMSSWSIFSLLMQSVVSSGFVTSLTVPIFTPRVDTMKQLVEGGYSWYFRGFERYNAGGFVDEFVNVQDPLAMVFFKNFVHMPEGEVEQRASIDKKITIMAQTYGEDFIIAFNAGNISSRALREYRFSEYRSNLKHASYGVQKQSPLLEPLARMTLRLQELGLQHHWRDEVLRRWPVYDTRHLFVELDVPTFSDPVPLALNKMQHVFIVLLLTFIISAFILMLEVIFSKL